MQKHISYFLAILKKYEYLGPLNYNDVLLKLLSQVATLNYYESH